MGARKMAGACALALLLVTSACGSSAGDEGTLGTLHGSDSVRISSREQVDVQVRPVEPIKLGKNTVLVTFPDGKDVELASVSALMPAHGHGSPPPPIERSDDGFVVRDLVLYMSGRWELRLELRNGTRSDEAIVAVDVP